MKVRGFFFWPVLSGRSSPWQAQVAVTATSGDRSLSRLQTVVFRVVLPRLLADSNICPTRIRAVSPAGQDSGEGARVAGDVTTIEHVNDRNACSVCHRWPSPEVISSSTTPLRASVGFGGQHKARFPATHTRRDGHRRQPPWPPSRRHSRRPGLGPVRRHGSDQPQRWDSPQDHEPQP